MKKLIQICSLIGLSLLMSTVFAKSSSSISFLYVIHASKGQLRELPNHQYTLVLSPMHEQVLYFSDRPNHTAGDLSIKKFLTLWDPAAQNSFATDHPNAAIVAIGVNGKHYYQDLVTLNAAFYDPKTKQLSFSIQGLDATTKITLFDANDTTIFIDPWTVQKAQNMVFAA